MMKYQKVINILVILIAVLALAGCLAGFLTGGGNGPYKYQSVRGETVKFTEAVCINMIPLPL